VGVVDTSIDNTDFDTLSIVPIGMKFVDTGHYMSREHILGSSRIGCPNDGLGYRLRTRMEVDGCN
jgi:hypothetical protein